MLSFVSEDVKCFTIETRLEKHRMLYSHKDTIGNKHYREQRSIHDQRSNKRNIFLSDSLKGNNQNKLITMWLMNETQQNGMRT